MTVILDKNGHAITDSVITVYSYTPDTHEYIGCVDEYLSTGIGLPANSTILSPGNVPSGSVAIYENGAWNVQPDLRGKTAYSTEDRKASTIDYIGPIRNGYTSTPPVTPYDKWDGQMWVTDKDVQHAADVKIAEQQKVALLAEATAVIAPLADAQAGGYIDDTDVPRLAEWQRYRYKLTKVDTSTAPNLTLPPKPEVWAI